MTLSTVHGQGADIGYDIKMGPQHRQRAWLRAISAAFCLTVAVLSATVAAPARAETVTQSYARAQRAIREGKWKLAAQILAVAVHRYPDYQPSRLLLAHVLYRTGKATLAAKQYRAVSPDLIGADLAFEYGASMFLLRDCRRAIIGFAKVPADSPAGDMTAFYRGICYLRQRDWGRAEANLERAANLPPNLEPSKRQALDQARLMAERERNGNMVSVANAFIIVPTPTLQPEMVPPPRDAAKAPPPPPPPPLLPSSGLAFTPALSFLNKSTTNDYHGFSKETLSLQRVEGKGSLVTTIFASPQAAGSQAAATFGADFGGAQQDSGGSKINYVSYANDANTINALPTSSPSVSAKILLFLLHPEILWPFNAASDLKLGVQYGQSQTAIDKAYTYLTVVGGYGYLTFSSKRLGTLKLLGAGTDITDGAANGPQRELVGGLDFSKTFATRGTIGITAIHTMITTTPQPASGPMKKDMGRDRPIVAGTPDSAWITLGDPNGLPPYMGTVDRLAVSIGNTWDLLNLMGTISDSIYQTSDAAYQKLLEDSALRAELVLTQTFELGGSISLAVAGVQYTGFKQQVVDPSQPTPDPTKTLSPDTPLVFATANGLQKSVKAAGKLAPVDWAYATVTLSYSQQSFSGMDPKLQERFEAATPAASTAVKIEAGLSKTF